MADIVLAAEIGRPTGSSASRRLRAQGKVPAIVYGRGTEPRPLAVDWRELRSALTTEQGVNALLTLDIGGKRTKAIVKELQRHPVRRDVLHVDFFEVDPDKPVDVEVTIVLEGEAEKVNREQGVVEQALNSIVITGKPADIPGTLAVDVSDLEIGQTITVADLDLPAGLTTHADPEETVVTAKATSMALAEEGAEGEEEEAEGAEGAEAQAEGGESSGGEGGE
ncbi:MAG TPA: 50S ribosomal protein L25 [Acidimicrobiales bacterium]